MNVFDGPKGLIIGIVGLFILLVVGMWGCGGIQNLEQGQRGVVYGKFSKQFSTTGLTEGFNWVAPGFYETKVYDCRTQTYDMTQKEGVDGLSSDGLKMTFDVTVQYHLTRSIEELNKIHQQVGEGYFDRWVRPDLREGVRAEMAKVTAVAAYSTERDNIKASIVARLQSKLEQKGIFIEDVLIRSIAIPESISTAIEVKMTKQQESQAMQYTLEKERQEAERIVIQAQASADQVMIAATAEADALNIKGEALRNNPSVLELEKIRVFGDTINPNMKWGILPPNITNIWGFDKMFIE